MYTFTFKNNDVLTLKAFKHSAFASQETHCFEASVHLNGKKIGVVSNQGHGGCDDFWGNKGVSRKVWSDLDLRYREDAPKWHFDHDDSWNDNTLEIWCCDQVNKFLAHKDFKRLMKSKVCFTKPKSDNPKAIYSLGFKGVRNISQQHIDHIKAKNKDIMILNEMPQEQALALWMEN
jgi:hypothetical protein